MKLSKTLLSVLIGMTMAAPSYSSFLSEQTDKMFNETLSNVTTPGAYETRQRGVLTGGQYTAHNRIRNVQLFSFSLPSISAGCGGIDIFAGSFSFINSDQLVALMRSIASNAVSYAFKVALETMSPTISGIITELNDLAQKINSSNINSCRIAQGFVNDIASNFVKEGQIKNKVSLKKMADDTWPDFSAIFNHHEPAIETLDEEEKKQIYGNGNIMYHALRDSSALTAFGGKNDKAEIEQVLSVTGMVIITAKDDTSESATDDNKVDSQTQPPSIEFKQLLTADKKDKLDYYKCKNDDCSEVATEQREGYEGLSSKIVKLLIGENKDAGEGTYINTLATNADAGVDGKLKRFFEANNEIQTSLVNLAKEGFDKQLLLKFVLDHADYIGYAYTKDFVRDLFQTVRSSIENSKLGNKSDALEKLKEWQERFDKQAEEFAREKNIYNRSMIIDSDALIKAAKERNASGKQLTETTNK